MAHISFDSSKLSKFVHDNELGEMQAMVNAADAEVRQAPVPVVISGIG
ncbi:glucose-6-phosphate isomerase [Lentilactobacillus farraginis DSM 18382 = JCM 14108]|uniref:Glucose-6-phosphate isomerase n=1 Tax=Lentilactobacillus farraginis DSM 18382 = JCM 14108 TaxID=1423743 RepID=X0PI63_9LACO|nr:glucose-6-phosphate isomerase [Lentilactobacillus farraginis DSM 18382 = JCM 14108]